MCQSTRWQPLLPAMCDLLVLLFLLEGSTRLQQQLSSIRVKPLTSPLIMLKDRFAR